MSLRRTLFLALAAGVLAAPGLASARAMIMIQGDGDSGLLLDKDEIHAPAGGQGTAAVWQMLAKTDEGADYTLAHYEFDCPGSRVRVTDAAAYAASGAVVRRVGPTDWTAVPDNSVGRLIMQSACGVAVEAVKAFGDVGPDEALREYRTWAMNRP